MVTAAILTENGKDWVAVKSAVYVARFRDHAGRLVERSTGCKDEAALHRLEAANEKNRSGSTLPIRADLADELRQWITERRLTPSSRLFNVPAGLLRILDRDLKAAGIPKRDERGRTIDVHALRHTFATWLSSAGVPPRTAQSALRHSDIRLTMNTYTDPSLLAVREALDRLPGGSMNRNPDSNPHHFPHLSNGFPGVQVAISGIEERLSHHESDAGEAQEMPINVDKKCPVLPCDGIGRNRADWIRTSDLLVPNQAL